MKLLNLIVVGSGMFVTGRGTDTYGTILPSVFEFNKLKEINTLTILSTSVSSSNKAKKKFNQLSKIYNIKIKANFLPNKDFKSLSLKKIVSNYDINCGIISVPDHLHTKFTIELMNSNVHCLVVKPMTTNKKDALRMIHIAEKNNLLGMVEFHKRYDHANIILREKIINNEIGNLQYSIIEYSQRKIIPIKIFKKWVNRTNIFQYLAIHYVDLIYYLTNFKPEEVTSYGQKDYLVKNRINNYDSTQVVIKWKRPDNKQFISIHATNWIDSNKSSSMSDQKIKIIGDKGAIVSDQKNRGIQLVTDDLGINDLNPYFTTILDNKNTLTSNSFGYGIESVKNFLRLADKFINNKKINIKNYLKKENNLPSFRSSYISSVILEAANKSLKSNKTIKIKL